MKAAAGSTKLTTLSKVEGPVEEPAHPTLAVGISEDPLRGLGERVAPFIVKGKPK